MKYAANRIGELSGIVAKYHNLETGKLAFSLDRDFEQALRVAPEKPLAEALAAAFRSSETPPFSKMLAKLYEAPQERGSRAELLNTIFALAPDLRVDAFISMVPRAALIRPKDTNEISVETVVQIALAAASLNSELIDSLSEYYTRKRRRPLLVNLDVSSRSLVLKKLADFVEEGELGSTRGAGQVLKRVPSVLATPVALTPAAEVFQDRYPAMSFYNVGSAGEVPLLDTNTVSPPPAGQHLEFHFWIDVVKKGIPPTGEWPSIQKPDCISYPLTFQVTVWSEDFKFTEYAGEVVLQAVGQTEHAKFTIGRLPDAPRQAELFVFLRFSGALVGAFRVRADVTEEIEERAGALICEYAYLAADWFRFKQAPFGSTLTIFITKKRGALQIFTLKPNGNPWATLGPNESGIYEKNKEIYQEVQMLANRAENAIKNQGEFKFGKEAKRLAQLGYPLFGDIFLHGLTEDAGVFADEYVRNLPEGSTLTIALGHEAQNLYIPWGLLYVRQPPFDFFETPELTGFLGYRYNLVVRPSMAPYGTAGKTQLPIRMGAAWLEHEQTGALREFYQPYQEAKKLTIELIRAEEHSLPSLAQKEYDLIEFFCHGHTKLPGLFTSEEGAKLLKGYTESHSSHKKSNLLAAIDESTDSLVELNGGFVTLTSLADLLKKPMPGHPIILLGMCESAQVSAGGTGFVPLFLRRGARAVIGTEGPTLWKLSREMDTQIVKRLFDGQTISQAFYETRKESAKSNVLALIYTLYGDGGARLV
jgi:hypothetical protein